MINMDGQVQEKIRKYREGKKMGRNISDGRNTIEKNAISQEIADNPKKDCLGDQLMQYKHRRYIQQTKQLMQSKSKQSQLRNQNQDLKTQIYFQQKKMIELQQYLKRIQQQQQEVLIKKKEKLEREKNQNIQMYEERIVKNIQHIEQLLKDKQEQNQKKGKFIEKKKKFQENKKKAKQKFQEQLKIQKQKWGEQEKLKRQNWQKSKFQQIQTRTLRNLQPQIQRIMQRSKDQVTKTRDKYQQLMSEFKKAADEQFEKSVKALKQIQAQQLEQQRNTIMEENSKKLKEQSEQLQHEFEQQRIKAKNDYNEQIRILEYNRRVESDEYIRKNRYFYTQNLQELKKLKQQYETKITELDGVLLKEVDERQVNLSERARVRIEELREQARIKLKKRMEEYDKNVKLSIQGNIDKLSNEIAVENSTYERTVSRSIQQKIRQERQSCEIEMKQLKKSMGAVENRIEKLKKEREVLKEEKEQNETSYLEIKNQNEYLSRKLVEISAELNEAKISEKSGEGRKQGRKDEVIGMWDKQIASIGETLKAVDDEIATCSEVMREKQRLIIKQTEEAINEIEKHSNKIIKQKEIQKESIQVKIEHEEKQRQNLKQILKKQLQLMKNYNIK